MDSVGQGFSSGTGWWLSSAPDVKGLSRKALAGGATRGWNHREAAFLTHLGVDAGCQLGPVVHVAPAWWLAGSGISQVWLASGLQETASQRTRQTACSRPALESRQCHFHCILLVIRKSRTHQDTKGGDSGRTSQWRGVSRSRFGPGDNADCWGQSTTQSLHSIISAQNHHLFNSYLLILTYPSGSS